MLTETEYRQAKQAIAHYDNEARARFSTRGGWVVIPPEAVDTLPPNPGNDIRSQCELFEFHRDKPERYFAYVREVGSQLITFTGDVLGRVYFGAPYRDNFGGERCQIAVVGVNGVHYYGTYYRSSGNYARIKAYKHQPQPKSQESVSHA